MATARTPRIKKICIIGLAKSGTTALYSAIKNELPEPRRLMFEPNNAAELRYITHQKQANALTKLMFSTLPRCDYDPARFHHNIAIVRDPRDMLVSSVLFRFNRMKLINDKKLFDRLVAKLEEKERAPASVDLVDILELAEGGDAEEMRASFGKMLTQFAAYIDQARPFVLTYDDMIEGRLDALNAHLGMTIQPPARLTGWIKKIDRKGGSGDWKNWLTPRDVAFFRDAIHPFLDTFHFSGSWDLNNEQAIDPEHCSVYVRRLAEMRKADPNLKKSQNVPIEALRSAAEDSKFNALERLYETLLGSSDEKEKEEAYEWAFKLGQMGYPRFAVSAGKHLRGKRERKRAVRSFRNAVEAGYPPAFFHLGAMWTSKPNHPRYSEGVELLTKGAAMGNGPCKKRLAELRVPA